MSIKNVISKNGVFKKAPMPESTDADNRFIVNTTMVDAGSAVSEKTIGEILSAYNQGKIVTFRTYGFPDHEYVDVEMYGVSKTDDGEFAVSAMTVDERNGLLINAFIPYTSNMEYRHVAVSSHPLTAGNRFTVTLTPTAADYSGTMDKTAQEITDAYDAGQEIEFDIPSLSVKCKAMEFAVDNGLIQAGAIVTYRTGGSDLLIEILTSAAEDYTTTYGTTIYALTPAT